MNTEKNKSGISPENILADNESFADFNGVPVRKGSLAAFVKNIYLLEEATDLEAQKGALIMLQELAPAIIATGLYKHAKFKNEVVQKILDDASSAGVVA